MPYTLLAALLAIVVYLGLVTADLHLTRYLARRREERAALALRAATDREAWLDRIKRSGPISPVEASRSEPARDDGGLLATVVNSTLTGLPPL